MSAYLVRFHEEAIPIGSCRMFDKAAALKLSTSSTSWLGAFASESPNPWVDCQLFLRKTLLFYKHQTANSKMPQRKLNVEEKPFYIDLRKCYLHIIPTTKPKPSLQSVPATNNKNMYLFEILSMDGTSRWLFDAQTERNQNHFVTIFRGFVIGSKTRPHPVVHHSAHRSSPAAHNTLTHSIEAEHEEIKFLFKSISRSQIDTRHQTQLRVIMHKAMDILPYSHMLSMKSLLFTPSMLDTLRVYPSLGHGMLIAIWLYYQSKQIDDAYDSPERRWKDILEAIVDEVVGILPVFEMMRIRVVETVEVEEDSGTTIEKPTRKRQNIPKKEEEEDEACKLLFSMVDRLLSLCDCVPKEIGEEESSTTTQQQQQTSGRRHSSFQMTCGLCDDILQDECCCTTAGTTSSSGKSTSSNPVECCSTSWYTILQSYFTLVLTPSSSSSSTIRSSEENLPAYSSSSTSTVAPPLSAQEKEELKYQHMYALFDQLRTLCATMKEIAYGASPLLTTSRSSSNSSSRVKTAKGASSPSSIALYRIDDGMLPISSVANYPSPPLLTLTLGRI